MLSGGNGGLGGGRDEVKGRKGGIGGNWNAGAGGGGVREGNGGKGRGGVRGGNVGQGGDCEERVGISGAMMVVNNMNNRANMVEIFGFWSWSWRSSALK